MNESQRRAAFVCSATGWGGLEMNVLKLADWLGERGWFIELFLQKGTRISENAKQNEQSVTEISFGGKRMNWAQAKQFARELKDRNHQIIFAFDNKDLGFAGKAKDFCGNGAKLIYQQHMQIGISKKDFIHTKRYNRIDCWISPLKWLQEEVLLRTKFPKERIRVIPLGTEIEKFDTSGFSKANLQKEFGLAPSLPVITILGRIDPKKGQMAVLLAIEKLHEKGISAQLLIVGEPTPDHPASADYVTALQNKMAGVLAERVKMVPFTNEVNKVFAVTDFFVLASEGETYGMVTIEAMLSGTPVVATNSGGTPELLAHGELGWLYPPGDVDTLTDMLAELLCRPDAALAKAELAHAIAREKYSHISECEKIEAIYDELIKS